MHASIVLQALAGVLLRWPTFALHIQRALLVVLRCHVLCRHAAQNTSPGTTKCPTKGIAGANTAMLQIATNVASFCGVWAGVWQSV